MQNIDQNVARHIKIRSIVKYRLLKSLIMRSTGVWLCERTILCSLYLNKSLRNYHTTITELSDQTWLEFFTSLGSTLSVYEQWAYFLPNIIRLCFIYTYYITHTCMYVFMSRFNQNNMISSAYVVICWFHSVAVGMPAIPGFDSQRNHILDC